MNGVSPWEIIRLMFSADGTVGNSGFGWFGQLSRAPKSMEGGETMNNQTVRLSELKEVWESVSGWYWFVTEYHEGTIAFGLVRGWETEWGYIDLAELHQLAREGWVWQVPKENWAVCPCVVCDAVSCSGRRAGAKRQRHRKKSLSGQRVMRGAVPWRKGWRQTGERLCSTGCSFAGQRSLNQREVEG